MRSERPRVRSVADVERLLAVLPDADRALWATAAFAGLRQGELLASRWDDVDLDAGVIRVERSWDLKGGGPVPPKSRAGRRRVPIVAALRPHLVAHRLASGGRGLAFGRTPDAPFTPTHMQDRADDAWEAAGLDRTTMHALRHTFASTLIAAGVNAKAISTYMGHANIAITFDRYGHLMPGGEDEATRLVDAYHDQERAADR